jgi:surface-anchored protein
MLPALGSILLLASALPAQSLFTAGHGDLGLGEGTKLEPHVHLSAGAVVDGVPLAAGAEFEADAIRIFVPDSTRDYIAGVGGRPADAAWDALGVAAGESFWFLPETNVGAGGAAALGAPFLGIGGEEVTLGTFDGNLLTLTLTGASMPAGGQFSIWANSGFGPNFFMSTVDGISALDTLSLDLDSSDHFHVNYGFTAPGLYALEFEVSALQGGSPVSASGTYSFLVSIPEPSSAILLLGFAGFGLVSLRRRR